MKKNICVITEMLFVATVICIIIKNIFESSVSYTLAISFGTTFYHFFIRLIIGCIVDGMKHNQFDYNKKWFQEKYFEKTFYKIIRVKSWKSKIPTFLPDTFDLKQNSFEKLIMATCQAEVVHEIIIVFSLLPIVFSAWFGAFGVFLITSIIAALIDLIFVIVQRYNRPRLLKLL